MAQGPEQTFFQNTQKTGPTKRCSASLIIREMPVKSKRKHRLTLWGWLFIQKTRCGIGADVEKRDPSCSVSGNADRCSCYGTWGADASKTQNESCRMSQQPHFWVCIQRKEAKPVSQRHSHILYLLQHSCISRVETWRQTVEGWLDKENTVCMYTQN